MHIPSSPAVLLPAAASIGQGGPTRVWLGQREVPLGWFSPELLWHLFFTEENKALFTSERRLFSKNQPMHVKGQICICYPSVSAELPVLQTAHWEHIIPTA